MAESPTTPPDDGAGLPEQETIAPGDRGASPAPSTGTGFRHGRFEPGQRLGSRYRIVARLGEGGMGEVYRADDLELGQSVALKFLPQRVSADPAWVERFRGEVRTARQVAHPNLCRIYDIGEQDGHVFLSMEYIDGEDLSGVLRRLGRPSAEKSIEIARQICLGLAAAHENRVLHRDLKPANIMIDGRGRVRITDFGLAGFLDELEGTSARAGTPAYMAPEQLASGEVSVRSDIYALGLVLHELFTGKPVFETSDIEALKQQHSSGSAATSSTSGEQVDPAVERVIARCLEQDPDRRPQSVYQVLAALPGGDPLAAALAAGETPSPAMVANARDAGGLRPAWALGLAAAAVVALVLTFVLRHDTVLMPEQSSRVMSVVTEQMAARLGFEDLPVNSVSGYDVNVVQAIEVRSAGEDSAQLDGGAEWPPRFRYWRRWSRGAFTPINMHFPEAFTFDGPTDAPQQTMTVAIDSRERLIGLIVPSLFFGAQELAGEGKEASSGTDWAVLFELAELDEASATQMEFDTEPPVHCDEVVSWSVERGGGELVTVVMGSVRGRVNYFEFADLHEVMVPSQPVDPGFNIGSVVGLVLKVCFVVLALRNIRSRRVDHRSAMLTAVVIGSLYTLMELLSIPLGGSDPMGRLFGGELDRGVGHILLHAVEIWVIYLGVEPYVRRIWPRMLVGVVRVYKGRVRDPAVGRELLIGLVCGCLMVGALAVTATFERRVKGVESADLPIWTFLRGTLSPMDFVSHRAHFVAWAVVDVSTAAGLLVIVRLIVRHTPTATVLVAIWLGLGNIGWFMFFGGHSWWEAIVFGVGFGCGVVLLTTRIGVLSTVVFIYLMRSAKLFVLDVGNWTATYTLVWLGGVAAFGAFALFVSLGGQSVFRGMLEVPEPGGVGPE